MILGAISNSWRQQLNGHELKTLVAEARRRGARHVELRQTCLGKHETGEGETWQPVMPRLQELVDEFPDLTFDLAMAYPCLSRNANPEDEVFQAGLAAARLVGRDHPHLRVVDAARFPAAWESPADLPASALTLVELAREAARQGVTFSMENSGQPIRSMALAVREARSRLSPEEGRYLGLCPDPTNQLRGYPDSDPVGELAALPIDYIKIVHFKQARGGRPHPTVDTGDLDCARMWRVLQAKGYPGVAIMEIPPHEQVFDNLTASFDFLTAVKD